MAEYEAYKDSGAVWIGKIPAEWTVTRLKNHLRRIDARNPGGVPVLSLYRELGIVPKDSRDDNHNVTSEDTSNYKYVQPGDFVVNKMKAWQGSVAVSDYEGIVSPAYYVYKFLDNSFHKRYFHYLIRSCYKEEFMSLSAGIRIGQWDLSSQDLDNVPVLIPAMTEQTAIAAYLDRETKRIDAIIAEAKASIEEYKAWKASIIYDAVTKGLDPNAEMKESGIDIIGSMPAHWETCRLKYLCDVMTGDQDTQNADENGEYPFYVRSPIIQRANVYTYDGEGILMAGDGAGAGRVFHHAFGKYAIHQRVYCFHNFRNINTEYYLYFISELFKKVMDKGSAQSTVPSVRLPMIQDFVFCIPSEDEQQKIVAYLNEKCSNIDFIVTDKEALITDLESYKKSLIFEVVTGKRKVV